MDNPKKPSVGGIGRGGRGVAILQLLQKKSSRTPGSPPPSTAPPCSSIVNIPSLPAVVVPIRSDTNNPQSSSQKQTTTKEFKNASPTVELESDEIHTKHILNSGRGQALASVLQSLGRGRGSTAHFARGRGLTIASIPAKPRAEVLAVGSSGSAVTCLESSPQTMDKGQISNVQKSFESLQIKHLDVVKYSGSGGRETPINVNCVRVKSKHSAIYQYHVSFTPVVDSRNLRFMMLNQQRDVIGQTKAFDGTILYLPKQLDNVETKLYGSRQTDNTKVEICIRFTQALDPASPTLLPFYNIVMRKCMQNLNMCAVGRNYYDPHKPKNLDALRLSLWPGFVTAIQRFEGGLLLNVDMSHKILRKETARHVMEDISKRQGSFRDNCLKELIGSTVLTRYNNKNYRIDDIAWDMTPESSFTTSKGEEITFRDYYFTQYKIEIKDLKQPMLIHRPKKKEQTKSKGADDNSERMICLVPELCFLTGITDKLRTDYRAMKQIRELASLNPSERNAAIEQFLQRINSTQEAKDELLRWGLELESHTCRTSARTLPGEKIMVGRNRVFATNPQADFSGDVSRNPVLTPVHLRNWLVVFTRRDSHKARQFFEKMVEVTPKLGIEVVQPRFVELKDDRSATYTDAISSAVNPDLQLVVVIFPTSRDDRYNALKKLCCVDMPVPSQVIISRTLPDDHKLGKFRSVTLKIAMQINCKLGGELWAVDIPLKGLMVCGIDVYHDGANRGRSVAAFVASTNRMMTRWYSRAIVQQQNQEIIDALKHSLTEGIKKYYEVNHSLPERIVIFRDGVGDGRLNQVVEYEVEQLQSSLQMLDKINGSPYEPKLTFVVVSKRINIKYFASQRGNLTNPGPGTVLDHTATKANWPDFFLVSQHVRQGTVSPTHYIVVSGQEHLKPDHMQRLAYKLTHMYYNWPGTVRVPAPCQYAHKLAYLVGENIRHEPSQLLNDRLFYL